MKIELNIMKNREGKYEKIGRILLGIILTFSFFSFFYNDMWITYNHSMSFLDCLFSGNFLGFYEYTLEHMYLGLPADYFLLIYILFGIWNFPTWFISRVITPLPEVVLLLWCKGIILLFTWLTFKALKKILEQADCKDTSFTLFLLCSSLCFAIPIFAIGQYDIITIFLVLFGVLQALKDEKISWKVMLLFAIAMPIKMFSVFSYIFLVLLMEKRIRYIIRDLAVSVVGCVLCVLPFISRSSFSEAMSYNKDGMMKVLEKTITGGISEIPVFIVCFGALCVFAWLKETKDKKELIKYMMWLNAALYVAFFIFVNAHPYWSVFMGAFLIVSMQMNAKNTQKIIILELLANVCLMIAQAMKYYWVYFTTGNLKWLLWKNVSAYSDYLGVNSLTDLIKKLGCESFVPAVYALFAVLAVAVVVLCYPRETKNQMLADESSSDYDTMKNIMYILRPLSLGAYCVITLMITYFI